MYFPIIFLVFLLVSSLEVEAAIYPLGVISKHKIELSYEITYTALAKNGESHFGF